jgi:subtilisin family serine protease
MKKHLSLTLVLIFLGFTNSWADKGDVFNYGPHGKNHFVKSNDLVLIKFQDGISFEDKATIISSEKLFKSLVNEDILPAPQVTIAKLNSSNQLEIDKVLDRLKSNPKVIYANQFLVFDDGTKQGIQDRILVRLKSSKDIDILLEQAGTYNLNLLKQNEFDQLLYEVQSTKASPGNALEIANKLAESKRFEYAEPDFLLLLKRFSTNDPSLNYQWSLNNTGSSLQYSGTPGADMNVFNAWTISSGNSSIKVAVIDEGVDLNHPDLQANLLAGYDATGQGSNGGPSGDDAHGTACAGIIAAVGNNNVGLAGVAFNCKIIPVRIAYSNTSGNWVTSNTWIGNALNWAWQTANADVLSNSWGGGSSSSTINNAITGAVNNGRGGLGAPVLFAAGNDNGANSYPATEVNTISVIAMSMCYERKNPSSCDGETWWGSNYGAGADIAAPGVKIYSTDISGTSGYSSGNYVTNFNGTSSATPNSAGVMALILSANPNLTSAQARYAIESTCRKVGAYTYSSSVSGQPNGTWSNDLGYGLVDAYAAMQSVTPQVENDAGISTIVSPNGSICSTSISPSVTLKNYGSNTLTSVTINYQIDGGPVLTYNWTGSLSSTNSTTVNIGSQSLSSGAHTFNAYTSNPNGNSDPVAANNSSNSSFSIATNAITLTLTVDNYPEETSWAIIDGNSTTIASGGTYGSIADGSTITVPICIADGCFDFVIYDAYGDGICCGYGNGSYTLTKDSDGSTLASGGTFTSSQSTNFCVQPVSNLAVNISTSTDAFCFGSSTGSASASATGGVPPYSYSWSNGSNGATVSNLSAGNYTVTVTDAASNQANTQVTIASPSQISAQINASNTSCFGVSDGTASVSVSGGTPAYSYSWSNGSTSTSISGLSAGNYSVIITDANGCLISANATITSPSALSVAITTSNASCNTSNDGSASANVTGGTSPYSYTWSTGANSNSVSGLTAGNYSVSVSDANGCSANGSVEISSPAALVVTTTGANSSCEVANDGSASSSVSGGTPAYSYAWSNGSSNVNLSGVSSGNYSLQVTDINGCVSNSSVTIGANTSDLQVTAAITTNISCFGGNDGAIGANAIGGSGSYTYSWSNGSNSQAISALSTGSYSVTVTDANGCSASSNSVSVNAPSEISLSTTITDASCGEASNGAVRLSISGGTQPYAFAWSNGSSSQDIIGVNSGNYSVMVTDANGCSQSINASVDQVSSLSASLSTSNVSCFGLADGVVSLTVNGGNGPYTYLWNNGSSNASITSVAAGNYSVTITDNAGCSIQESASVTQPDKLSITVSSVDASCGNADGSASADVIGGTSPYVYSWSNGANSATASSLSAQSYTINVSDENACTVSGSATISEDCGGCSYVLVNSNDFEAGLGIWNAGGSDGYVSVNSSYASSGSNSMEIRDNTNTSVFTTSDLNLLGFTELTIDFSYYPRSMDNASEDFWLQVSTNGGASFTTVEEWNFGDEFVNNQRYFESVVISGTFNSSTQLRFRCDASGNADWVNIDDVTISGCYAAVVPTCTDGVQNGDETGIDCGGNSCVPCATPCVSQTIDSNDFEAGWGIWNDGGSDVARVSNSSYSNSGSFSIQLRDNSGSVSSTTTDALDLSSFNEVTVSFSYMAISMENGEDFWLQYSTDGSTYITAKAYVVNADFVNGTRYNESVIINDAFSSTTTFRFRCDASGNSDWVYIDDVTISGCLGNAAPRLTSDNIIATDENTDNLVGDIKIYPNPSSEYTNVEIEINNPIKIRMLVIDISGKLIIEKDLSLNGAIVKSSINTTEYKSGMYFIVFESDYQRIIKKLIIQH